jgi:hypothetical protein
VREVGITRVSALGGLANTAAPYWPNPVALRAAQFLPEKPIDAVLADFAASPRRSGSRPDLSRLERFRDRPALAAARPLYCAFGFCWQRTWDRPFVPDIEAVPAAERDYYERHGCFQHNNPA